MDLQINFQTTVVLLVICFAIAVTAAHFMKLFTCDRDRKEEKMKNAERIARDVGFKIGQYERGEISAKDLVKEVHSLAKGNCAQCAYRKECFTSDQRDLRFSCETGFDKWLDAEVWK